MTRPYIFSKGAAANLRDITRYIVAVFHERMDLMARLMSRLTR